MWWILYWSSDYHSPALLLFWKYFSKEISFQEDINGLVQDCSNSSVLAVELLQPCTKQSTCYLFWYVMSAVCISSLVLLSIMGLILGHFLHLSKGKLSFMKVTWTDISLIPLYWNLVWALYFDMMQVFQNDLAAPGLHQCYHWFKCCSIHPRSVNTRATVDHQNKTKRKTFQITVTSFWGPWAFNSLNLVTHMCIKELSHHWFRY